jgi:hypothetical protein
MLFFAPVVGHLESRHGRKLLSSPLWRFRRGQNYNDATPGQVAALTISTRTFHETW